jgi:glycerophosphoryl diester phosphodiesterase
VEPLLRGPLPPVVIAHRGASADAPENTLPAFRLAWAAGTTWVEADVQPTADAVPVLLHDDTVDRTTDGSGAVRELTAARLADLDAGSWKGAPPTGVPTLAALVAELTADRRLLLEIKGAHTREQVAAELEILHTAAALDRTLVQSFELDALAHVRALLPDEPVGLLVEHLHDDPVAVCADLHAIAYNPDVHALLDRPALVGTLHTAGIAVMPYTSDDPAQWAELTRLGVDGIITNRPAELLSWQASR